MKKVKLSELNVGDKFYIDKKGKMKFQLIEQNAYFYSCQNVIKFKHKVFDIESVKVREIENRDVYLEDSNIGELTIKINVEHNLDEVKEKLEEINKLRKQGI